eukprot:COSAG01_NODE_12831_length_1679_cov_1.877390_2_plen_152_part_00
MVMYFVNHVYHVYLNIIICMSLYSNVCMYIIFIYVAACIYMTPPECHMPPSPRLLFQPTTCFCVSCSLRPRLLRPRHPLLFCPLALPRSGARVFDSLWLRCRCCALGLGTCEKEDRDTTGAIKSAEKSRLSELRTHGRKTYLLLLISPRCP